MRAGPLKYRITIMQPQKTAAGMGATKIDWTDVGTIWAERVKLSSVMSRTAKDTIADYSVSYNIRAQYAVNEGWRIKDQGGTIYQIAAIEPNIDRGYKTLICKRVNN